MTPFCLDSMLATITALVVCSLRVAGCPLSRLGLDGTHSRANARE